jgi:hypothetical protein
MTDVEIDIQFLESKPTSLQIHHELIILNATLKAYHNVIKLVDELINDESQRREYKSHFDPMVKIIQDSLSKNYKK